MMSDPQQGWKVQNLRLISGQVRNAADTITGTAFAVNNEPPRLVTCRHVIEQTTPNQTCAVDDRVQIYFPKARSNQQLFPATVIALDSTAADDVVLLELHDEDRLPLGVDVAVLGDASQSVGFNTYHEFQSYGFPELKADDGIINQNTARGEIINLTAAPGDNCRFELLELDSRRIGAGMSGGAVLDMTRNLIVGVVNMKYYAKYAEFSDNAYAVESKSLTVTPLNLQFYTEWSYRRDKDPLPRSNITSNLSYPLEPLYRPTRPPRLPEWTGRVQMLRTLDDDLADPQTRLVGLIGYGGEGKSSLAFRWLDSRVLASDTPPEAVFWWSFYEDRSVETMLEALTRYLLGETIMQNVRGTSVRVEMLGAMLKEKRVLLVLDGFEVLQHQTGDSFGEIVNSDLRRLLQLVAQPQHRSFGLVTSRAPLTDLLPYDAYQERPLERLTDTDGQQLLRKLDVSGTDDDLTQILTDWDGHALTVSLVGSYLVDNNLSAADYVRQGKNTIFPQIAATDDPGEKVVRQYRQVRRVMQRYDTHLTDSQKAFLKLFSVFRLPVNERAFETVFRTDTGSTLNAPLTALDDRAFEKLLDGLQQRRLIKRADHDSGSTCSAHPLVQQHYRHLLETAPQRDMQPVHQEIAAHYEATADYEPPSYIERMLGNAEPPSLDDLRPYIEIVHHLCRAGAYDEAVDVFWQRISQGNQKVIQNQLGAYETYLNLMHEFFPDGDTSSEPQVSNSQAKRFILNEVGFCLMNLGRLDEAAPVIEKNNRITAESGDPHNASIGYRNLAALYEKRGRVQAMQDAAEKSLSKAQQVDDERYRLPDEQFSLGWIAWANHLLGNWEEASKQFKQAESLCQEIEKDKKYLYSLDGICHAEHLRRRGAAESARRITEANLDICSRNRWIKSISQCHRVLGDLDADDGQPASARPHYDRALSIARQIDKLDVLIEALLGRGRFLARHTDDLDEAFRNLHEALGYIMNSGYRIYEVDVKVALAWAHLAAGNAAEAGSLAGQALALASEIGYVPGREDAQALLSALSGT